MDLNQLWFLLVAALYTGFFLLEGFDFGVGMLLPFLGRDDPERRAILNTIGPHWDANEVWLITAGGATFAAFPGWYADMFSGFYPLLFLLLLALIVRGVAFEFRGRRPGAAWRGMWDWALAAGSFIAAGSLGIVFGNLLRGTPIDAGGIFAGSRMILFNPFGLLCGSAAIGLFLLHGANFLGLKLDGELGSRARNRARRLFFLAAALVLILIVFVPQTIAAGGEFGAGMAYVWGGTVLALLLSGNFLRIHREGWAFVFGGIAIAGWTAAFFVSLYPRVMVSSLGPEFSLTIYNAAASDYALRVMTVVAGIFLPVVIAYQAWSYWVFRRRIAAGAEQDGY
jgi:cytochrome d ubiquinol oxidase subunit II